MKMPGSAEKNRNEEGSRNQCLNNGGESVGPPKNLGSRQVEEENPQDRADRNNILYAVRHTRFCAPEARGA